MTWVRIFGAAVSLQQVSLQSEVIRYASRYYDSTALYAGLVCTLDKVDRERRFGEIVTRGWEPALSAALENDGQSRKEARPCTRIEARKGNESNSDDAGLKRGRPERQHGASIADKKKKKKSRKLSPFPDRATAFAALDNPPACDVSDWDRSARRLAEWFNETFSEKMLSTYVQEYTSNLSIREQPDSEVTAKSPSQEVLV
ncbi:MAG: hypothetical protein AAF368_13750, partial [Planctomycetota bacterium]